MGPTILLADIDNTLYDWPAFFAPSFRAMVHVLARELELGEEELYEEFRVVFNRHSSLEYAFAIQELESVRAGDAERIRQLIKAGRGAFNKVQRSRLRPYPGVVETLKWLREQQVLVVGVTNSPVFRAQKRLYDLKLDSFLSGLVAWEGFVFREQAARLSELQASVRAVRLIGDANTRKQRVRELQQTVRGMTLAIPEVAIELLYLIRDELGWEDAYAFASALPAPTRSLPVIREQALFALAESGDAAAAIAGLEQLIDERGATPERLGLIGGRYKRLWRDARKRRVEQGAADRSLEELQNLERAIDAYTRGMQLDYNAYYCSSNLPQLLQARGTPEDLARGALVHHFVLAACERALALGIADRWLRPTLLGAAFRSGELDRVRELANRVALEGAARWELESTLKDLQEAVAQTQDPDRQQALHLVLDRLDRLAKQR